MEHFGPKVKQLRQERQMTREDFCEDEAELSVRQLARIESGVSLPTLNKVYYIAKRLQVSVGDLTQGGGFEIPKRYKELKYMILRVPTYANEDRLKEREEQFDEIYNDYYDNLPEEEQLVVDCMQAKLDVNVTDNVDFGTGLLSDYFEQIKLKKHYGLNELIIIHLYMACFNKASKESQLLHEKIYNDLLSKILRQINDFHIEDLFVLTNVLLTAFACSFRQKNPDQMEAILKHSHQIMTTSQDFQKMPILYMLEWKYQLHCHHNQRLAKESYDKAILFAQMTSDAHLERSIHQEWEKDISN